MAAPLIKSTAYDPRTESSRKLIPTEFGSLRECLSALVSEISNGRLNQERWTPPPPPPAARLPGSGSHRALSGIVCGMTASLHSRQQAFRVPSLECKPLVQGKFSKYTFWEQMDSGKQFTPAKKFLTVIPLVL